MALGLYTTFTLDMVPGGAPPIIHVSAEDIGRKYTAKLTYNGAVYDIQGNRLTIAGTKPDGTVFEYPVDDFERDESWVDFLIEEQMAIVSGKVLCELREYLNNDQIGSANFILDVETAVYDPEAASESYIPTYETAIQEALENVADDIADLATAAAINDVKQYSDAASESATAAASSAAAAAVSEQNAFSGTPDGYAALVNTVNRNSLITHASLSLNTSANTTITTGLWYCGQWADTPANVAKSGYLTVVEAFADSVGAYVKQLYSPYADSEIWFRTRNNGTWTDWQKLPTRAEVDALKGKFFSNTAYQNGTVWNIPIVASNYTYILFVQGTDHARVTLVILYNHTSVAVHEIYNQGISAPPQFEYDGSILKVTYTGNYWGGMRAFVIG